MNCIRTCGAKNIALHHSKLMCGWTVKVVYSVSTSVTDIHKINKTAMHCRIIWLRHSAIIGIRTLHVHNLKGTCVNISLPSLRRNYTVEHA